MTFRNGTGIPLTMMEETPVEALQRDAPSNRLTGLFAGGGVTAGLSGLAGATCCILPIFLANLGAGTALLLHLRFFVRNQLWFSLAAFALVCVAGYFAFRGGRRPGRIVTVTVILSAVLTAASLVVPFFEADLVRWAYGR